MPSNDQYKPIAWVMLSVLMFLGSSLAIADVSQAAGVGEDVHLTTGMLIAFVGFITPIIVVARWVGKLESRIVHNSDRLHDGQERFKRLEMKLEEVGEDVAAIKRMCSLHDGPWGGRFGQGGRHEGE